VCIYFQSNIYSIFNYNFNESINQMSTIDKIRSQVCVRRDKKPCSRGDFCKNPIHDSWSFPTISLIHLLPNEVTAWYQTPDTIIYQRDRGAHYRRENGSLVIIINHAAQTVIGCGTISEVNPETSFKLRDVQVCIPIIIPKEFMVGREVSDDMYRCSCSSRISTMVLEMKEYLEPIVVNYARIYKTLRAPTWHMVEEFRRWVLRVLERPLNSSTASSSSSSSASSSSTSSSTTSTSTSTSTTSPPSIPLPPSRNSSSTKSNADSDEPFYDEDMELAIWNEYIKDFHKPLWVYIDTEDMRIHMTIKADGQIVFHHSDCVYPNIMVCLQSLIEPLPTAEIAMRTLHVGQGTFEGWNLWYIGKRHPGSIETVGINYNALQEACRQKLARLSPGIKFIVNGFPEELIYLREDRLFKLGKTICLAGPNVINKILGRTCSLEESFEMLHLNIEGMFGHGLSLAEILLQEEHLESVGVMDQNTFVFKTLNTYINENLEGESKDYKVGVVCKMFKFLYKYGSDFIESNPKFRDSLVKKCYEFIQKESVNYPQIGAICRRLLTKCGEHTDNLMTNEEVSEVFTEFEGNMTAVCERIPFLIDIHANIVAKWKTTLIEMPRGTGSKEILFAQTIKWLKKYSNVLKHSVVYDWNSDSAHYSIIHYGMVHENMCLLTANCERLKTLLNFGATYRDLTKIEDILVAIKKWIEENGLEAKERTILEPKATWVTYQYLMNYTDMLRMLMD